MVSESVSLIFGSKSRKISVRISGSGVEITCCQQFVTNISFCPPTNNCLFKSPNDKKLSPHLHLSFGLTMALKPLAGFSAGIRPLGFEDPKGNGRSPAASVSWRFWVSKFGRLECVKPVDDDNVLSSSSLEVKRELGNGGRSGELGRWSKDLSSLPKPLSATDISISNNGSNVRVAFQGSHGAFSESAALRAYPECETVPCEQFEVAFKAVELWLVDKAVLPIENTFSGSYHRNYDLLLRHRLHIVGEVQLTVNYCLMALPGVRKEDLKRVLSHPLAFPQCKVALSKLSVVLENADDTASAAQSVSYNVMKDAGAIASSRAASIYGLNILEEGVQDCPKSVTRFLILAREPIIPRTNKPFKTSIVFTLEEGPGVIFKALSVFALRSINLSKIESRPQRKRPLRVIDDSNHGHAKYFDYLFYIDFEASMAEPRAQSALAHLQEYSTFLRVLGSYPMDIFL